MNTESLIISLVINVLGIGAFVIDRIYRISSIKEYKEAKEAQIATLKEQIEFLSKHNDDFLSKKFKERFDALKLLMTENESQAGNEVKYLMGKLEDTVEILTAENGKLKDEKDAYKEALNITLELFDLITKKIDLSKVQIPPVNEQEQKMYAIKFTRVVEIIKKYDSDIN